MHIFIIGHTRIPFKQITPRNGTRKNNGIYIFQNGTAHVFAGITVVNKETRRVHDQIVTVELVSRNTVGMMRVLYRKDVTLRGSWHGNQVSYQTFYIRENFKVSRDTKLFIEISDSSKLWGYSFASWINGVVN